VSLIWILEFAFWIADWSGDRKEGIAPGWFRGKTIIGIGGVGLRREGMVLLEVVVLAEEAEEGAGELALVTVEKEKGVGDGLMAEAQGEEFRW
jgi:hypothetical protein